MILFINVPLELHFAIMSVAGFNFHIFVGVRYFIYLSSNMTFIRYVASVLLSIHYLINVS